MKFGKRFLAFGFHSLILGTFVGLNLNVLAAKESCAASLKTFLGSRVNNKSPTGLLSIETSLLRPKGKLLRELADGSTKRLNYIVDPENRVYFVKDDISFVSEKMMVATQKNEFGELIEVPIKEGGHIEYVADKKTFRFVPDYEPIDLAEEEISMIRISGEESGEVIAHSRQGAARAKMMDCQKVYEAQRSGKTFVWDQFVSNNALLTLSIAAQSPTRFWDTANYDLLVADYVMNNEHTMIRSFTGRYVMLNGMGYAKRMGARISVGLGSTQVQGWTAQLIVNEKNGRTSGQRAEKITEFNRLWMVPSLVKSDALDKFVLRHLPEVAYDLCLKGSPLRIFASPKMVRFAEGWLSTMIYFSVREWYTGEDSGAPQVSNQ